MAQIIVDSNYVHLYEALCDYGLINNKIALIHFFAQTMHETSFLRFTKEIWTPTKQQLKYEGNKRLGNFIKGDGKLFMGRGAIMTTGRANYQHVKDKLGVDCVNNTALLELPQYYWQSSCLYFAERSLKHCIDLSDASIEAVTKSINGGLTHIIERKELTKKIGVVFG